MKLLGFLSCLLGLGLATTWGFGQVANASQLWVLLSEIQPGSLSTEQHCTLVFADHHFHSERAIRHHGKDTARKIYEGELSEAEWNSLTAIVDSKGFRELTIPRSVPPLVMQDTHPYTISVAHDGHYQNMEFLDSKSLKPYESQIKPLLQWWKSLRGQRRAESNAPPNPNCNLDNNHAVISQ